MRTTAPRLCCSTLALLLFACGSGEGGGSGATTSTSSATTTSTGGGGGAGGTGSAGSGGQPDLDKSAADVTDPEECYFEGHGGDIARSCNAAVIELSGALPRDALTIVIEASDGTVFDELLAFDDHGSADTPWPGVYADDPATSLTLVYSPGGASANEHYAPEWLDVEVRRSGVLVGADRFEPLDYACHAEGASWCWESEPVTLEVEGCDGPDLYVCLEGCELEGEIVVTPSELSPTDHCEAHYGCDGDVVLRVECDAENDGTGTSLCQCHIGSDARYGGLVEGEGEDACRAGYLNCLDGGAPQ